MKKLYSSAAILFASPSAFACVFCNKEISNGIYNSTFYPNLLTMLSAFIVIGIIVAILSVVSTRRHRKFIAGNPGSTHATPVPLMTTSVIIGIGLGGFIDGIVLHQILQWHEMLSNKIPSTNYIGKSINMFWDGIFHAFCVIVVLVGVVRLWALLNRPDINRSGYLFSGGLIGGWGLFNLVEGVIDHHILKLHNVIELSENHDIANYAFLAFSIILLLLGYLLIRKGSKQKSIEI